MTEPYTFPCLRCRHTAVEIGPVLEDSVTCSRCGCHQPGEDYATVHALLSRFRDENRADLDLPCQDCGAFGVPYTEGTDPMEDLPCPACERPQFLDDYRAEIQAMSAWHAWVRANKTQALVERFELGVLCPSCKNRLYPDTGHAAAGVPCGECGTFTPLTYWLNNEVLPDPQPDEEPVEEQTRSNKTKLIIGCGCAAALGLGLLATAIVLVIALG